HAPHPAPPATPDIYTLSLHDALPILTGVLDYYIAYQRITSGVRKRLLATLVYPVILVTVATGIVTYIVSYVIPQFSRLYSELNIDRKSTRLNSSHLVISYAVFCLKKK